MLQGSKVKIIQTKCDLD